MSIVATQDNADDPGRAASLRRRVRLPKVRRPGRPSRPSRPRRTGGPGPLRGARNAVGRTAAAWRLVIQSAHPVQAIVVAVIMGVLASVTNRGVYPSIVAGLAVFCTQMVAGLLNDLCDAPLDRRADLGSKPLATGDLPRGNVTYAIAVLVLISIPLSIQSGTIAGLALLATLPVAYLHNAILHRTPASPLGWMATAALFAVFLSYGGWGGGRHGSAPAWQVLAMSAAVGLCVHFATSLPDLVADHRAKTHNLPLLIALKIGAPALMWVTIVLTLAAVAGLVLVSIHPGLRTS